MVGGNRDELSGVRAQESAGRAVMRRGGLGRGLDALIPSSPAEASGQTSNGAASSVPIDSIVPNPYQPRATMDDERLDELAQSIRTHGVIQPLIVAQADEPDRFVLIAGERRWRASALAGLNEVPVVVKNVASQAMLELALVENVVRADLSPLEEAHAYRQLIGEFGLTQASVASRVGRSRVAVTNTLRLLNAPEAVQIALQEQRISEGHARALLGLPTAIDQVALLRDVEERGLNVRQTEDAVRRWTDAVVKREETSIRPPDRAARSIEHELRRALATRVSVKAEPQGEGGVLSIHYYSEEHLQSIVGRFLPEDDL